MRTLEFPSGGIIDLDHVIAVEPLKGDSAWRRYVVMFLGNTTIEVYEHRRDMEYYMPRKLFVAAWAKAEATTN